jgi:hypothetical protein
VVLERHLVSSLPVPVVGGRARETNGR